VAWEPWQKAVKDAMGAMAESEHGKEAPWKNVMVPMAKMVVTL